MELSGLYDLIKYLEYGTNLHIGVVFLNNNRNLKCTMPHSHTIHSKPICELFKKDPAEFERCLKCRNFAIKKAVRDGKPFAGHCINGIYEYTRPVFFADKAVAVIYVGNILTEEGLLKLSCKLGKENIPTETMESAFDIQKCEELSEIIEGYICTLIEKYPEEKTEAHPIIENIRGYILSNLEYDISLKDVASLYFYNEVYLGRLFREKTGKSFREFVNFERVKRAKELLLTDATVIEVAETVGYNNVTYFNRIFKKETGITPGEYRLANSSAN